MMVTNVIFYYSIRLIIIAMMIILTAIHRWMGQEPLRWSSHVECRWR